ncbi:MULTISPECIES: DUF6376 family protein [Bacillus cereus group]|uniref:DUF6376 family protein n=1 Tax=Bacillus cereus group TaxID=86661 RepID=UPI000BF150F7|nr:DUF6376 family protein [Bacillus toyonensis]PEL71122.1 hypothetical protein CN637_03740 [Bacillus toyonensis]PEO34075.1 hypothetical protein CN569_12315 [Bacillus toyonensis]PEP08198.1 hypothetical protein CN577_11730 [Bacillus toyonensis]PEP67326.1 hypothetical protein CN574_03910 [Bacillus toyonensis]PGE77048.1 hypothetical protein COM70_12845 [Bacillus toyonensis]
MKAKKLICFLALPLMLVAWVGCSKDNTEEKKTDSLKVSESEKKKDESIDKEADKLYKEKEELLAEKEKLLAEKKEKEELLAEKEKLLAEKKAKEEKEVTEKKEDTDKNEVSNDKTVKEAVIGEGRTLAEEREYRGKQLTKGSSASSPLEKYQEDIKDTSNDLKTAVQSIKSLAEKDGTWKTTQTGLKGELSRVSGRANRLASIEPPKEYDYFKVQLRDDARAIKQMVDQAFIALNENDTETAKLNIGAMIDYVDIMSSTLNEIQNVQNGV